MGLWFLPLPFQVQCCLTWSLTCSQGVPAFCSHTELHTFGCFTSWASHLLGCFPNLGRILARSAVSLPCDQQTSQDKPVFSTARRKELVLSSGNSTDALGLKGPKVTVAVRSAAELQTTFIFLKFLFTPISFRLHMPFFKGGGWWACFSFLLRNQSIIYIQWNVHILCVQVHEFWQMTDAYLYITHTSKYGTLTFSSAQKVPWVPPHRQPLFWVLQWASVIARTKWHGWWLSLGPLIVIVECSSVIYSCRNV